MRGQKTTSIRFRSAGIHGQVAQWIWMAELPAQQTNDQNSSGSVIQLTRYANYSKLNFAYQIYSLFRITEICSLRFSNSYVFLLTLTTPSY